MPDTTADTRRLLQSCCVALDDKKAMNMQVLDVTGLSSITSYLIVASAMSPPHLKALRQAIQDTLKKANTVAGSEFGAESGWLVVDAFEIMVHLFLPVQRDHYRIESLWKDAKLLDARAACGEVTRSLGII